MNCSDGPGLVGDELRFFIKHYITPLQITFGLAGNMLTVVILNSQCLRSRTTILLTCLTLADAVVLLCLAPGSLATFSFAYLADPFRRFYYASISPLLSLQNAASCASIWLALSVTVERVLVISRPLRAQLPFSRRRMGLMVGLIFGASLAACAFSLLTSTTAPCPVPFDSPYENLTRRKLVRARIPPNSILERWIHFSYIFHVIFVICIPFIAMIILNWILLHFLRHSRRTLSLVGRTHSGRLAVVNERKIGTMVCVIVGAFILFNLPSAAVSVFSIAGVQYPWLKTAVYVSNTLVATGKTLNFVFYCVSSPHFRRRVAFTATLSSLCYSSSPAKSGSELTKAPYVFRLLNSRGQPASAHTSRSHSLHTGEAAV